jgi:HAD superfamily hydrolase (TIGR01509 family)
VPDLVIYDCDGTLVDSERIVARVCLAEIHALGLDWSMDRYFETFVGMPGRVGWGRVREALGRPLPDGLNDRVDAQILRLMGSELELVPGARAAIEALGGNRCVASSTEREALVRNIRYVGLHDLFGDSVFSASQVNRAKPAPDVFLFSASQMGSDPQDCVVIEDSVPGVLAARRAGMQVIGYTGVAHNPDQMQHKLKAAGAAVVASHMQELPGLLRAL